MNAQTFSSEELRRRTLERRAVEAAIWGMPIVSVHAMREAFFRDAKAKYNDIVFWSKPSDWQNQTTTPNASARYVYFNFNTLPDGPVVLEVPAAVGAGLFGTLGPIKLLEYILNFFGIHPNSLVAHGNSKLFATPFPKY